MSTAEDEALNSIPAAADEMPPPQATYGEPRGPGHRGLSQIPLLATTGNDMSSKESVDMPMEAMTHPAVEKVSGFLVGHSGRGGAGGGVVQPCDSGWGLQDIGRGYSTVKESTPGQCNGSNAF